MMAPVDGSGSMPAWMSFVESFMIDFYVRSCRFLWIGKDTENRSSGLTKA
jgi:hypothetical protein